MRFFKYDRGFSLVEMLGVVSIIGMLAAVVMFNVQAGKEKARDAQRASDMQQVQIALRVFKDVHGKIPTVIEGSCGSFTSFGGCLQVLVSQGSFSELPKDPQDEPWNGDLFDTQMYFYSPWCPTTGASDQHYRLWANGEGNHNGEANGWWQDNIIGVHTCPGDPT